MPEYDTEKVVACMFDPVASEVLSKLETGPKSLSQLAIDSGVTQGQVLEKLSYLVQYGFVIVSGAGSEAILSADAEKLSSTVDGSSSFDGAVDSITTMDSYLN